MGNIDFYVQECNDKELQEFLSEAKKVANMLHRKVTIHTMNQIYEVNEDEEEKEEKRKDVKYP